MREFFSELSPFSAISAMLLVASKILESEMPTGYAQRPKYFTLVSARLSDRAF